MSPEEIYFVDAQSNSVDKNSQREDFLSFATVLTELWVTDPVKYLKIIRGTIYFSFKHFLLQVIYLKLSFSPSDFARMEDLKMQFFDPVTLNSILMGSYKFLKYEVIMTLYKLSYEEASNKLLISKLESLIVVIEEIANKANGKKYKKKVAAYKFAIENIRFNYDEKTIDYEAFVNTFHEFEYLVKNFKTDNDRLSKLFRLLLCYCEIIEFTHCFKVFELPIFSKLTFALFLERNWESTSKLDNLRVDALMPEIYAKELYFLRFKRNRLRTRFETLEKNDDNNIYAYKEFRSVYDIFESAGNDHEYIKELLYLGDPCYDSDEEFVYERMLWDLKIETMLENHLRRSQLKKSTCIVPSALKLHCKE